MNKFHFILFLLVFISCNSESTGVKTTNNKETKYELYENSTIKIISEKESFDQYIFESGNNIVLLYENKDITIIDALDYDVKYTEILVFEFNPSVDEFEFTNEDLKSLNCKYFFNALSKDPKKEVKDIVKGTIRGKKIDNDTWNIIVEIDTDFKFGSYLDRQDSQKVKFNETIKITSRQQCL